MTYEYKCTECDHCWQAQQKINDDPILQCPACDKDTAVRLISGGQGFILKGSGWFKHGY